MECTHLLHYVSRFAYMYTIKCTLGLISINIRFGVCVVDMDFGHLVKCCVYVRILHSTNEIRFFGPENKRIQSRVSLKKGNIILMGAKSFSVIGSNEFTCIYAKPWPSNSSKENAHTKLETLME